MSKYIDADRLIAEIERLMSENCKLGKKAECFSHRAVEDNAILALVESLQQEQPEVDLEKVTNYSRINKLPEGFDKEWLKYYHNDNEYNSAKFHHTPTVEREYIIARHFWFKGYNARKEE